MTDEPEGLGLSDYLGILRRRIWYLILPAVLIFAIAVAVAMLLPATYRSTGTILIEQQQIPQDLVRTTVTSYADQRVQTISQRVMTTTNLSKIIEKYDLFRDERKRESLQSLAKVMREDIALDMIDAKVVDPRSGSAKTATIAFSLSFQNESPKKAQQVTNELVSLFLNENLRKRQEAAQETSAFLTAEADRLLETISVLEAKVASFKETHGDNLPGMRQINTQFLQRVEDQIDRGQLEESILEQRISLLESELARTDRYAIGAGDGSVGALSAKERLAQLELTRMVLAARAKENHPDLVYVEREIDALRQQTGGLDKSELRKLLEQARATLDGRRSELADTHPDVRAAQASVAALEARLADADEAKTPRGDENPNWLRLQAELKGARAELAFLRKKRRTMLDDVQVYEERLKEAPKIERDFSALTRGYNNAVTNYREIKAKQMEAELAESLETERKAERFVLIEPPLVPNEPIKPNRIAIVLLGAALSLGGGLGSAVLRETMSAGMYGSKAVFAVAGAPPMAVIPFIETEEELATKRRRKWLAKTAVIVLVVGGITAVHLFVRPLDIIAYQAVQRLDLIQPGGG